MDIVQDIFFLCVMVTHVLFDLTLGSMMGIWPV